MFWIILTLLGIIFATHGFVKTFKYNKNRKIGQNEKVPGFAIICTIITILFGFLILVQALSGMTEYPYLIRKLAQVETLQQRIEDIRNSNYEHEKEGSLIAGSVENWKQSTNLSTYISELATLEANYNGYLEECKVYKSNFPLFFFGYGWAISDKVLELQPISK